MRTPQDILENMEELINEQKKEIASLKELLERALPKVMDRKYAMALANKGELEQFR